MVPLTKCLALRDCSPDASWVELSRWNGLTLEQQESFIPLCLDFVVELRSPSDSLKVIQAKLQEYMENGARLGWLIHPQRKVVEVYRRDRGVEILSSPDNVLGEDIP